MHQIDPQCVTGRDEERHDHKDDRGGVQNAAKEQNQHIDQQQKNEGLSQKIKMLGVEGESKLSSIEVSYQRRIAGLEAEVSSLVASLEQKTSDLSVKKKEIGLQVEKATIALEEKHRTQITLIKQEIILQKIVSEKIS